MPCVVCQHCQGLLSKDDWIAIKDGYSYHKKCHNCYVCGETNLKNAEVFKGVIFCFSCSQRIFQGCSSARRSKNGNRKAATLPVVKRRNRHEKRADHPRHRHVNGVLELTRLAASSDSETSSSTKMSKKTSKMLDSKMLSKPIPDMDHILYDTSIREFKKKSAEIGITTDVTQELLRQMNCPVADDAKTITKVPVSPKLPREKGDSRYNKTIICSDLRIAELGTSTEIAHMALRKKSALPVIIKSYTSLKEKNSSSSVHGSKDSDGSEFDDDWLESAYSLNNRGDVHWLDRRIGSLMKIPYRFFKHNILSRSSLVSAAIRKEGKDQVTVCDLINKLKFVFHEEITEHQSRGIKRLYSTINRRRTPYRLGWLNIVSKVSAAMTPEVTIRQRIKEPIRCKHFRQSHSYRCMRAQVMKQAGPTKSELAVFRRKLASLLSPVSFMRNAIGFTKEPSVISEACGSNRVTA